MAHQHKYDENGQQLCCRKTDKIYSNAGASELMSNECCKEKAHHHSTNKSHEHEHEHGHSHEHNLDDKTSLLKIFLPSVVSLLLLISALMLDHWIKPSWFHNWVRIAWYVAAYIPVGLPVLKEAIESILKKDIFSEFLLMSIATVGAFAIGEYPEGVAVMLFYALGEIFQTLAVSRAQKNIKSLLEQRPDEVTVLRNNQAITVKAETVTIGEIIQLKPGEKLGLDGVLISENATFNTAALTGESKPDVKQKNAVVLAGMINLNKVCQVQVTTDYDHSKISKILELVQNAVTKKAPTELFIRKFAKIYTPIVVALAIAICFIPYFFVHDYVLKEWLYRALIFLVISCPCALVISIPLGYFGGIGAASRNGILFKGSNYLDTIATIKNVVMDKTGTLTEGVFKVQEAQWISNVNSKEILAIVSQLEQHSSHPVATAIHEYAGASSQQFLLENIEEIVGHGLVGYHEGKQVLAGNTKLLEKFNIDYDRNLIESPLTIIAIAYEGNYVGHLTIADKIKNDAAETIQKLHQLNVKTTMLSGDKTAVVHYVAKQLKIDSYFGDLMPEDKVQKVEAIKSQNGSTAFVGDGINDAPVVALSDVGIAMGGLGSDATIETADVVIQDDMPSRIALAVNIGKQTKRIVWQNITLAFVVKAIVLILGAGGLATMWEAVFADVGVALLAILNAVRIQKMKF